MSTVQDNTVKFGIVPGGFYVVFLFVCAQFLIDPMVLYKGVVLGEMLLCVSIAVFFMARAYVVATKEAFFCALVYVLSSVGAAWRVSTFSSFSTSSVLLLVDMIIFTAFYSSTIKRDLSSEQPLSRFVWGGGCAGAVVIMAVLYYGVQKIMHHVSPVPVYTGILVFVSLCGCFFMGIVSWQARKMRSVCICSLSVAFFFLLSSLSCVGILRGTENAIYCALVFHSASFFVIFSDIVKDYMLGYQEKQSFEKSLAHIMKEKDAEVMRISEALRQKTIESHETSRIKSELLANMSHELRTPMNSIIGFTARVIKKADGLLPEQQLKNLKIVERNAYHLLSLINTILDVSKIEAGRMELFLEECTLAPLVQEVIEMGKPLVGSKEVSLIAEIPDDLVLMTDKTKVKQILINLMGNALKFTERGSVSIRAQRKEFASDERKEAMRPGIVLSVADTGIGIKQDDMKFIFDDYKQVDGSFSRKTGGTGLGLSLVKRFTQLLGGTVTVESEYERGTTFHVWLPLEATPQGGGGEKGAALEPAKKHNSIVYWSSKEIMSSEFIKELGAAQYECLEVTSSDAVFTESKERYPRMVVLDFFDPEKKCIESIHKVKTNYYTKDTPIIAAGVVGNAPYLISLIEVVYKPIIKETARAIAHACARTGNKIESFILLDTDSATLEHLREALQGEGVGHLRSAHTCEEVMQMMHERMPDCFVINPLAPHYEGFRLLLALSTRKKWSTIPVVFLLPKIVERAMAELLQEEVTLHLGESDMKVKDVHKHILARIGKGL